MLLRSTFQVSQTIPAPTMHEANNKYYSTLYLPYEAKVDDATAYYGATTSTEGDTHTLQMQELANGIIPANQGVLLVGTSSTVTLTLSSTNASLSSNKLSGVCTETTINSGDNYLVFGKSGDDIGFFKPSAETLAANRAYITYANAGISAESSQSTALLLDFGATTGISNVAISNANASAPIYDLSGRRVVKATKGLYIQNGKKFLIR